MALTVFRMRTLVSDIGPKFVDGSNIQARVKLLAPGAQTAADVNSVVNFAAPQDLKLSFTLDGAFSSVVDLFEDAKRDNKVVYVEFRLGPVEGATDTEALAIFTQPSTTASTNTAFTIQPVVQLTDPSGNYVHTAGVVVTATRTTGTDTLGGTATATTNDNGQAIFTNLKLTTAGGTHTDKLTFSATGYTSSAETTGIAVS